MNALVVEPEKCRVCGCTAANPCVIVMETYEGPCAWLDIDHTICTSPRCVGAIPLIDLEEMPIIRQVH